MSRTRAGHYPNGLSQDPSISSSGRYVAYASFASDIVAGDDNEASDVFLLDRTSGTTIRVPATAGYVKKGGSASEPAISADGNIVVFVYKAPVVYGTVAAATTPVVLAYDRRTRRTTAVSPIPKGLAGTGAREPAVSGDGRFVAYTMNWIWWGRQPWDAVVWVDRDTGGSVFVSVGPQGRQLAASSSSPSVSADGNLVAFVSNGGDTVVRESTGRGMQAYVRDMKAKKTERISAAVGGGPANGVAATPAISGNGRFVAFQSTATNLVDGPGAGAGGIFRRDRRTGTTIMVSLTEDGAAANGLSIQPSISPDGNMVAFSSSATGLVAPLGEVPSPFAGSLASSEVYIRDIAAGQTVWVSVPKGSPQLDSPTQSWHPAVAGNGRYVAFDSNSPALAGTDPSRNFDVFLRDLPPAPVVTPPALDLGAGAVGTTSAPGAAVLSNTGWSPLAVTGASLAGANTKDFQIVADGCAKRVLRRGEACTVTVLFRPTSSGGKSATLRISDGYSGSPRTVGLRGRASQGRLALDPPIGPPGTVVIATGSDFPPSTAIRLTWSQGITPTPDEIVTDAAGKFQVPVLVFHNDVTGRRDLVADPVDGAAFPRATAEMRVTMPTAVPPRFETIWRLLRLPTMLVIRG